MLYKCFIL